MELRSALGRETGPSTFSHGRSSTCPESYWQLVADGMDGGVFVLSSVVTGDNALSQWVQPHPLCHKTKAKRQDNGRGTS